MPPVSPLHSLPPWMPPSAAVLAVVFVPPPTHWTKPLQPLQAWYVLPMQLPDPPEVPSRWLPWHRRR